jgi:Rrf2 family protein
LTTVLRISDAASMALHTMAVLAADPERYHSAREIARKLAVSEAHLAKVLQRLGRAGLVKSVRGPKGGFKLGRGGDKVTLLHVYEAVDGPFRPESCLMEKKTCSGSDCIMGPLLELCSTSMREYLKGRSVSELIGLYE